MVKSLYLILVTFIFISLTLSNENIPSKILNSLSDKSNNKELFKTFNFLFKKNYDMSSQLARDRFATFKKHLQMMKANTLPHQMGFSEFFDLTDDEFRQNLNMNLQVDSKKSVLKPIETRTAPFLPISWHESECATEPYALGGTSSFSTSLAIVTAIEHSFCIKNGNSKVALSIQQLIDCTPKANDWPRNYEYYTYDKGLSTATDYPYHQVKGTCKDASIARDYKTFSWEYSANYGGGLDIPTIYSALTRGPIVVNFNFYVGLSTYKSGILTPASSTGKCAYYWYGVVVGYGLENNVEYWVVKSYTGSTWGENGYFRLIRDDTKLNWGISCGYQRPI